MIGSSSSSHSNALLLASAIASARLTASALRARDAPAASRALAAVEAAAERLASAGADVALLRAPVVAVYNEARSSNSITLRSRACMHLVLTSDCKSGASPAMVESVACCARTAGACEKAGEARLAAVTLQAALDAHESAGGTKSVKCTLCE